MTHYDQVKVQVLVTLHFLTFPLDCAVNFWKLIVVDKARIAKCDPDY